MGVFCGGEFITSTSSRKQQWEDRWLACAPFPFVTCTIVCGGGGVVFDDFDDFDDFDGFDGLMGLVFLCLMVWWVRACVGGVTRRCAFVTLIYLAWQQEKYNNPSCVGLLACLVCMACYLESESVLFSGCDPSHRYSLFGWGTSWGGWLSDVVLQLVVLSIPWCEMQPCQQKIMLYLTSSTNGQIRYNILEIYIYIYGSDRIAFVVV